MQKETSWLQMEYTNAAWLQTPIPDLQSVHDERTSTQEDWKEQAASMQGGINDLLGDIQGEHKHSLNKRPHPATRSSPAATPPFALIVLPVLQSRTRHPPPQTPPVPPSLRSHTTSSLQPRRSTPHPTALPNGRPLRLNRCPSRAIPPSMAQRPPHRTCSPRDRHLDPWS